MTYNGLDTDTSKLAYMVDGSDPAETLDDISEELEEPLLGGAYTIDYGAGIVLGGPVYDPANGNWTITYQVNPYSYRVMFAVYTAAVDLGYMDSIGDDADSYEDLRTAFLPFMLNGDNDENLKQIWTKGLQSAFPSPGSLEWIDRYGESLGDMDIPFASTTLSADSEGGEWLEADGEYDWVFDVTLVDFPEDLNGGIIAIVGQKTFDASPLDLEGDFDGYALWTEIPESGVYRVFVNGEGGDGAQVHLVAVYYEDPEDFLLDTPDAMGVGPDNPYWLDEKGVEDLEELTITAMGG